MSIMATLQVRMRSTRLPGKALCDVGGKPLLGHLLDRVGHAKLLDGIVVATSIRPENDPIEAYCATRGIPCFRGDEDDVLGRMLGALQSVEAEIGVEVFGDCPLIDPAIIDHMINIFQDAEEDADFASNDLRTTYPPGMEVEVFRTSALADSDHRCSDPAIREHGTLFIRQNPSLYRLISDEAPPHFRRPELEMEVDTAEDLAVFREIIAHFQHQQHFGLADLIDFLDSNPEIASKNRDLPRRWKEFRDDI